MAELCALDVTGDTKLIWNPGNTAETEAAQEMFRSLKGKGYLAYSVKKDGEKGEVLSAFDANAEKIIMAPPMRGG
jgi:hypothetical protein